MSTASLVTEEKELTDEQLFESFRTEGDQEALVELIRRYERPLYRYLVRYCGDTTRAEDLFQTTFARVIERSDQFTAGRRIKPWLYGIATHCAIDARRRAARQKPLEVQVDDEDSTSRLGTVLELLTDREPAPSARLEREESQAAIRAAVDSLPEDWRSIVILAYYEGLTLAETAEALNTPLGTVKSRLHKALLALHRKCSGSDMAGE